MQAVQLTRSRALLLRRLAREDDVGRPQPPARLQHAMSLAQDGVLVGREVDDAVGDDDVERRVGEGHVLHLAEAEAHVLGADAAGVATGKLDHVGAHVEADDAALRAHLLRREEAVEAAAAAQVEHRLALVQAGDGRRVAAAERREDVLRQVAQLFGGVQRLGDVGVGEGIGFAAAGAIQLLVGDG